MYSLKMERQRQGAKEYVTGGQGHSAAGEAGAWGVGGRRWVILQGLLEEAANLRWLLRVHIYIFFVCVFTDPEP